MSLALYRVFTTVAKTGSFQKAAEELNYSPSAISHSIARLEEKFGFRLLVRSNKGVNLTSYGKAILPYLQKTLDLDNVTNATIHRLNGLEDGSVRLGVLRSLSTSLLPPIVRTFHAKHPEIQLLISEHSSKILESKVLDGNLDLALITTPFYNDCSELNFDTLFVDPFLCIMPKNETPLYGSILTMAELESTSLILPGELYEHNLLPFFHQNNIIVRYEQMLNSDPAIFMMVATGTGRSILPQTSLPRLMEMRNIYNVHAFPIEKSPSRTVGLLSQSTLFLSPAAAVLRDIVLDFNQHYDISDFQRVSL